MARTRFSALLGAIALGVSLTACGGGTPQTQPPAVAFRTPLGRDVRPARVRIVTHLAHTRLSKKLLFVSNTGSYSAGNVTIYNYPGWTLVGTVSGFQGPAGECTDGRGDVWVTDVDAQDVVELSHDGNYVNELPATRPYACAVDPKTGDFAVIETVASSSDVAIFHNAAGTPTRYYDGNFDFMYFLGYDNRSNLFVDGVNALGFHYAELPAGSTSFTDITLSQTPDSPGNVQWDGKYMAVGDEASTIYQTSGSTVVSSTTLQTQLLQQFYIVPSHKKVIAPDELGDDVGVYSYPAGGTPSQTIRGGLVRPVGVVLSI